MYIPRGKCIVTTFLCNRIRFVSTACLQKTKQHCSQSHLRIFDFNSPIKKTTHCRFGETIIFIITVLRLKYFKTAVCPKLLSTQLLQFTWIIFLRGKILFWSLRARKWFISSNHRILFYLFYRLTVKTNRGNARNDVINHEDMKNTSLVSRMKCRVNFTKVIGVWAPSDLRGGGGVYVESGTQTHSKCVKNKNVQKDSYIERLHTQWRPAAVLI